MNDETLWTLYSKIAKAARWLFWVSLVYTIYFGLMVWMSGITPMNPVARGSAWGRFRWYSPHIFDLICLIVPLFFLYFFQSRLRKGVANSDDALIKEGLNYLFGLLVIQVILSIMRIIFQDFIQPTWWGI